MTRTRSTESWMPWNKGSSQKQVPPGGVAWIGRYKPRWSVSLQRGLAHSLVARLATDPVIKSGASP